MLEAASTLFDEQAGRQAGRQADRLTGGIISCEAGLGLVYVIFAPGQQRGVGIALASCL